jgi:hypothetical protein
MPRGQLILQERVEVSLPATQDLFGIQAGTPNRGLDSVAHTVFSFCEWGERRR